MIKQEAEHNLFSQAQSWHFKTKLLQSFTEILYSVPVGQQTWEIIGWALDSKLNWQLNQAENYGKKASTWR